MSAVSPAMNRLTWWTRRLTRRYPSDTGVAAIREDLVSSRTAEAVAPQRNLVVAVECVESNFYFGLFSALCQGLRARTGAQCDLVVVRSVSGAVGTHWTHWLARSWLLGAPISAQWVRAFRFAAERVAFRSQSWSHPLSDVIDWLHAHKLWRRLRDDQELAALSIKNVPVGDLIADTYLRFCPAPRIDVRDPFVRRLIWQAYRDIRRSRGYFRKRRPQLYLTSYSTYVEHGVPVRVALQEGVRVSSFGNFVQFGRELTAADWFHTPDTSDYRATFQALDHQEDRLRAAEEQLRGRLSGHLDAAMSYMRVSAYAAGTEPVPDVAGAAVLFLHDFYDSPHVYDGMIFHDFWAWTCFTIDTLKAAGRKFWVKPHPNQISLSGAVLQDLRAKYPDLPLLSPRITNVQLVDAGIACGVTVYGTVGHELAYLGVPTIASAKHPHHSFDFCRTARSVEQYREYLQTAEQLPLRKEEMRRQALAFYYMHNLYGGEETLTLRSRYTRFWKDCHNADATDDLLVQRLRELLQAPGFKLQIARLADSLGTRGERGAT